MEDGVLYYFIFRRYSIEEEREGRVPHLYGWTTSPAMKKAFFEQRSKKKYLCKEFELEEVAQRCSDTDLPEELRIDYIELPVAATGEKVYLLMTESEMREAEIKVQRMFRDKCRLIERDNGGTRLLNMFRNLELPYSAALEIIGFQPPEIDDMFNNENQTEKEINMAYDGYADSPSETREPTGKLPGMKMISEVSKQILYSLESFVKVLREDL